MSFSQTARANMPAAAKYINGKKSLAQITADIRTLKPATQATVLMAFAMVAEEKMGFDGWYAGVGATAHEITMSLQERWNLYGAKMYAPSDRQVEVVLEAALRARE